jgi:nitrogen regulatory protein P-II 1
VYVALLPKIEIKIIAPDAKANEVVQTIIKASRTGEIGDGKIFVSTIEEVYRIRTGDRDERAL